MLMEKTIETVSRIPVLRGLDLITLVGQDRRAFERGCKIHLLRFDFLILHF